MNRSRRTAFLILSCDAYSGLWDAHFRCLNKYWADCPFPKYILTNNKDFDRPGIQTIKVGEDVTWSANLLKALQLLKQEYNYVLVTFDDLFLVEKVNSRRLDTVLDSFHSLDGQFLQLIKWYNRPRKVNDHLGLVEKHSLYRPNCVFTLWNISVLEGLLMPEENAWEFEKKGSARSDNYEGFYVVLKTVFNYRNTVITGRIVPKDARLFGLVNSGKLKVMTLRESIHFRLRYWAFSLFLVLIPHKWQISAAAIKNHVLGRSV
jgi:hypothetical protein